MRSKASWLIICITTLMLLTKVQGQPYGLSERPAVGSYLNNAMPEAAPVISGDWSAVPAFPNVTFTNAIGVLPMPGTDRLVVWEREGRIWSFVDNSNVTEKKLVLDIHDECQGWDDSGLLGLAFHPGFATNHFVFIYYTWVVPGTVKGDANTRPPMTVLGAYHDRLARFTLDTNGVAIPGSETVIIDQTGDSVWHNGGGMFFHPANGFLYWTDGDDANGTNTQTITNNLFSGVFRVDVDKRGGAISHPVPRQPERGRTANYYIPNDNPFVGVPGALEEYFCLGLRNPHRMTIDPLTGRIFIGDVGEQSREEVDVIEPGESGLNFQWNRIEGLQGDLIPPYIGINRRPIMDYTHSEGAAVIGGYVYRGREFATDLGGKYIFGDNVSRTIWMLDETKSPAGKIALCTLPRGTGPNAGSDYCGLSSFGLDQNSEILMCQMSSIGGRIYKLSRAGAPAATRPLPKLISQTGAFADLATLKPSPGLVPYNVNSPLWSDGAVKHRWIALATNTAIGFAADGEWSFPNGTVFVKEFDLPVDDTNPARTRRLETRVLVCDKNGAVYGASYKWRPDYSDADLVVNETNEDITVTTATGTRIQTWSYPGRQDCLRCHAFAAGGVLGVKTRQINGDFTYPDSSVTDNQLRTWSHIGMFHKPVDEAAIPGYTRLVKVTDTNAPLEFRVRSYLDANCSQCHRPGGVPALFDARIDTPLAKQGIVNGFVANPLNIAGARVIVPGDTNKSILLQRINSFGDFRMPPLARNVIDSNAVTVITAWINSVTSKSTNSLPAPWNHTDIGSVALSGDASFSGDQFDVIASGNDVWNNADQFHFVYQPLTGDGEIKARIVSVYNSDGWAKAGVMFRESLAPGSKQVLMAVSAGNGTAFIRRTATGDDSHYTAGTNTLSPYWVRMVRRGDVFTGYTSPDGSNWLTTTSVTNVMNRQVYVGLAVTGHNNQVLNSSVIDHVTVSSPQTAQLAPLPSSAVAP
jgi:uncharacterized repeat protein (TIGR03806 family)